MSVLEVRLAAETLEFAIGGGEHSAPVGFAALSRMLPGNPPAPADLTNAIGLVLDHLDDVDRELPMAAFADEVYIRGDAARVVCAVELGRHPEFPFALERDALEDVFRTVATEAAADRALNPGLDREWVDHIIGACCALVAIARRTRPAPLTVHP